MSVSVADCDSWTSNTVVAWFNQTLLLSGSNRHRCCQGQTDTVVWFPRLVGTQKSPLPTRCKTGPRVPNRGQDHTTNGNLMSTCEQKNTRVMKRDHLRTKHTKSRCPKRDQISAHLIPLQTYWPANMMQHKSVCVQSKPRPRHQWTLDVDVLEHECARPETRSPSCGKRQDRVAPKTSISSKLHPFANIPGH